MCSGSSQLFPTNLTHIAEDVSRKGAVRVAANEDALYLNPWKALLVLLEVEDEIAADVATQRHRRAGRKLQPPRA